jgi:hypothetical protein
MKKNLPLYLLTGLFLLVYTAIFDTKIDLGGDNAGYYILGKALNSGSGYTDIHLPEQTPANHFPPGYPALMAIFMFISDSFVFLKAVNGVLFLATVLLLYKLFERTVGNPTFAFLAAVFTLLNGHLLRSSTIMMSEVPFLFFSVLVLTALVRWESDEKPFWKSPVFWAMVVLSVISYHIRTAGIALVGAVGLYLLFQKRWVPAVAYGAGFLALSLPWYLRGKALGGNGYLQQLFRVNPYRPEEGLLDGSGWVDRIVANATRYLTQEIPNGFFPAYEVSYQDEQLISYPVLGLALLGLIVWGALRMPKLRSLYAGYLASSGVIFLLWPDVWFGVRFLQPLIPFAGFAALVGAWDLLQRLSQKTSIGLLAQPAVLAVFLLPAFGKATTVQDPVSNHPCILAQVKASKEPHLSNFNNYFHLGSYVQQNTPETAVICTYKPALFYLYANRTCTKFESSTNPDEVIAGMERSGVTHVVIDQMGYASVGRYLVPAVQQRPERFRLVLQLPNPDTYLLELLPAKSAAPATPAPTGAQGAKP